MDRLLSNEFVTLIAYAPLICINLIWSLIRWLLPSELYAKDVSRDTVLITGAGSGLGRALAVEFARLGTSIVAWDINEAALEQTRQMVQDIYSQQQQQQQQQQQSLDTDDRCRVANGKVASSCKFKCLTYLVDVSNREAVQEAAAQVNEDLKRYHGDKCHVSILINNAGIYHGLMLHELKDEQIERIFKINVMSHFWTVRAFIGDMISFKRGHIVEIASMAGISGLQKQVDYCSSKFATIGFEDALHMELNSLGMSDYIKSTVVCPFFFSSNLFTDYKSNLNALMSSDYVAKETIRATRCNQNMIMLPKRAYLNYLLKSLLPRETFVLCSKAMGYTECVRDIKGAAAAATAAFAT